MTGNWNSCLAGIRLAVEIPPKRNEEKNHEEKNQIKIF